jgi:hypothetical protein
VTRGRVRSRSFALLGLVLAVTSCSHASSRAGAPSPTSAAPKVEVLVTIGSDATFGDGLQNPLADSWPQKLYHEAFPRSAVLVNASDRAVTVDRAAVLQVPLALQEHATVVAVWLGDTDLQQRLPAASFESNLDGVVEQLRDSGARVLLGNLSRERAGASAYDDAIARIARARGATLVDLAAALSAHPGIGPGSLVNPTTSGKIAEAFAVALARS